MLQFEEVVGKSVEEIISIRQNLIDENFERQLNIFQEGLKNKEDEENLRVMGENLKFEIANELDNGKKKFKNETERKVEFNKRIKENEEYQSLEETVKKIDIKLKIDQITYDHVRKVIDNLKYLIESKLVK